MHRLIRKINKKSLVLPLIFMIIVSMTVVCASVSSNMLINGDAYVRAPADIRVDSVTMMNPTNGAFETYNSTFSKDKTSLYATLPALNSTITYRVAVKNTSSDTYILSGITSSLSNDDITSNIDSYEGTIIAAGSTVNLDITFEYDTETLPDDLTQTAVFNYTFEIPSASMIEYTSEYTSSDNVQDALDELFEIYDE